MTDTTTLRRRLRLLPLFAFAAALGWMPPAAVIAQDAGTAPVVAGTEDDAALRTSLEARVDSFSTAISTDNHGEVISVMPPKILAAIAESVGLPIEEMREALLKVTVSTMAEVTIEKADMLMEGVALSRTSADRPYALVPTEMRMSLADGTRFESTSQTLALYDEGAWYLMRIEDVGKLTLLRSVYPDFEGIEIPKGSMKILGEE